jgi:hypothetical protein
MLNSSSARAKLKRVRRPVLEPQLRFQCFDPALRFRPAEITAEGLGFERVLRKTAERRCLLFRHGIFVGQTATSIIVPGMLHVE